MTITSPRITVRGDMDTQALLSEAIEKYKKIMKYEYSLKLSERDTVMLVNSLGAGFKPNARLQETVERLKLGVSINENEIYE